MEFNLIRNGHLGFFSDTFRLLHTYMVCKKTDTDLFIESSNWNFGRWHDYFITLKDSSEASGKVLEYMNWDKPEDRQFTVADYRKAIQEVFIYTPQIYERVDTTLKSLSLDLQSTVAIFIRRGDKLLGEAVFIPTEFYVKLALTQNPKHIFVQTDDYRAFLEAEQIINHLAPHVKVHTTCPPTKFGMFYEQLNIRKAVTVSYTVNGEQYINDYNIKYLQSNIPQKPIIDYSYEEMKEHVEEMLVGILICQRARCVALDHMSNVGRYIVFSHPRGKEAILAIEDLNLTVNGSITRIIPPYQYTEDKYIRNPRFHSIYNEYI
jgi:hypothetical protein